MVIECQNLAKWYGQVVALNDLSITIGPGVTGLLGPNGAGKSTFMRLLMGLQRPSSGTVQVLGENPWGNPALLQRLGYVPEGDAPWQDDSARTTAERTARIAGMDPETAMAAAERVLAQVGLADVMDRKVSSYSKGMRQRLKFALALIHEPELLILDEPLIGADPITRRDLIQMVRDHARAGGSVLLSTHVLSDVEALTDRILVMDAGRQRAYGTVAEIRDFLEQYPRTVRIDTLDPRAVGQAMWAWPSVVSLQSHEQGVVVRTDDPQAFYGDLQAALADEGSGLDFSAIHALDENIESVFRYLVGGERQ